MLHLFIARCYDYGFALLGLRSYFSHLKLGLYCLFAPHAGFVYSYWPSIVFGAMFPSFFSLHGLSAVVSLNPFYAVTTLSHVVSKHAVIVYSPF